jgi:GGDEF domain-containing protein
LQHENGMDLAGRIERLANNADQETDNGNILSISVGQAFYPADGSDAEQLLAEADRRMYAIKNAHHAASDRVMATVAGLGVGH